MHILDLFAVGGHDRNFFCQVFYYKETHGWKVTFAFFLEEKKKVHSVIKSFIIVFMPHI